MSNIQNWGSYDIEAAQDEEEELAKGGGEFLKLEVGRNVVRFLPPKMGARSPFLQVHQHFVDLPGMPKPASFNCPRMMAKKPCPVCQEIEKLRGTGNPADYDLAGQLFPRLRIFANVISRKNPEAGPQILAFGKQIHKALIELRKDEDAGGDFTDPTANGFDVVIARVGTGKNDTEYSVLAARGASALGDLEWIDMQHDLGRYGIVFETDVILRMLGRGGIGGNGGGGRAQMGQGQGRGQAAPAQGRNAGGASSRSAAPAPARRPRNAVDDAAEVDEADGEE